MISSASLAKLMISIIIPTKNEEAYLAKTLQSLQRVPDCEVIVSDGNSTDATLAIARQFADRVEVYQGVERQTIAGGRNLGARHAQGEFLVFLDADVDVPEPDRFFQRVVERFRQDDHLIGLTVALRVQPDLANWMDKVVFGTARYVFVCLNNFLGIGACQGEFQMIRTEAFRKLGGYREDLVSAEDHDMFYRLSQLGKTHMQPDLCVFHTGRRAHKIGWPKLLWEWAVACFGYVFMNRSIRKEWDVVR